MEHSLARHAAGGWRGVLRRYSIGLTLHCLPFCHKMKRFATLQGAQPTLWAAARAGSDTAESARPERGAWFLRRARWCARLLRGRLLPWRRVRLFLAGARD